MDINLKKKSWYK